MMRICRKGALTSSKPSLWTLRFHENERRKAYKAFEASRNGVRSSPAGGQIGRRDMLRQTEQQHQVGAYFPRVSNELQLVQALDGGSARMQRGTTDAPLPAPRSCKWRLSARRRVSRRSRGTQRANLFLLDGQGPVPEMWILPLKDLGVEAVVVLAGQRRQGALGGRTKCRTMRSPSSPRTRRVMRAEWMP